MIQSNNIILREIENIHRYEELLKRREIIDGNRALSPNPNFLPSRNQFSQKSFRRNLVGKF